MNDHDPHDLLLRIRRLEEAEAARKYRLRTMSRAVAIGAVACIVALPGLATALGPVPNVFSDGDLLSAQEMNDNFSHVVAAITALEEAGPGGPDVPCGVTDAVGGNVNGYQGGAAMCADACGDPQAHICTTHELIRYASAGKSVAVEGWVATGVWSNWSNNGNIDDCQGFTAEGGVNMGLTWRANDVPGLRFCSGTGYPLHCCAPP